jgi:predicted dehydrogenase/threonine dehydrogenase-like Zn-dependent dehydrogenase
VKQILTSADGIKVVDVPAPCIGDKTILVRVQHSCISVGTEIAGVKAAGEPLYRRALRQPEKVRRAVAMLHEKGIAATLDRIRSAGAGVPLGYSAAGVVIACGTDVSLFGIGDRVACAGSGIANHAEIIEVPVNLAVKIPTAIKSADAATVALGAIALQGVRRATPALGETVLVVGLGILGQLTVQLLKSNGCKVIGADLVEQRAQIGITAGMDYAANPGSDNYPAEILRLTDGYGADAVIVTAATPESRVINDAVRACRRKGRIIIVGDIGLDIDRSELYAREIDLLISTSYGPGRYDAAYELEGCDYPLPYVRWTENRNMEAYLDLLAAGKVQLKLIPTQISNIDEAVGTYRDIQSGKSDKLLFLLNYPENTAASSQRTPIPVTRPHSGRIRVALIGAGSFAQGMHLPNLAQARSAYSLHTISSRNGVTARTLAERYGAAFASTDTDAALNDPDIDLVFIATRHHLHATLALKALAAGKHVFVEKPLALKASELDAIEDFFRTHPDAPLLMTGFNRRFSPALARAHDMLAARQGPAMLNYRVNAGFLPPEHWVHGEQGGGRNIGEACHIYDVCNFLIGGHPQHTQAQAVAPASAQWRRNDNFVATLGYPDGSVCTVTYTSLGHNDYAKERMEIFVDGMVIALDDYKALTVTSARDRNWNGAGADKGHTQELSALADGILSGTWPISLADQIAATRTSFEIESQLQGTDDAP